MENENVIFPHSEEAEMGTLCSIFLSPAQSMDACENAGVDQGWFHIPKHGQIFASMQAQWKKERSMCMILLTSRLHAAGALDRVGGPSYIADLSDYVATASMIDEYLEILNGFRLQRDLIRIAVKARKLGFAKMEPQEAIEAVSEIRSNISALTESKTSGECTKSAFETARMQINKRRSGLTDPLGMPTGITKWDERLKGLHPTVMYVIASRPGIGKTSAMEKMIERTIACERHCLVVQKDMSVATMIGRMAARRAGISYQRFFQGTLTEEEMQAYEDEVVWMEKRQEFMHLYNTSGMTGEAYAALIRKHKEKHDIKSSFLDHFLLPTGKL